MLAPQPVPRLGFDARIKGVVDTKERTLKLSEASVDFRNLHAIIAADVANLGRKPRFAATLKCVRCPVRWRCRRFPSSSCRICKGFKLAGTFSTDLHLGIDLEDLEHAGRSRRPRRHRGLQGAAGAGVDVVASGCRRRSSRRCEYEPGKWMTFVVGPESPIGCRSPTSRRTS